MNKRLLTVAAFALAGCVTIVAQDKKKEFKMPTGYAGITHEMSEFYEPVPPVVTPGTDLKGGGFTAPSDAIVLFDGKDLSAWESVKGGAAEWDVHDGVFTVNKKKGDIQTKQKFNDFQMHIEWQVPTNITGESQSRGNSGIFLQGMYEVQVLDCYNNPTYVNGQTGSIYKQSIPLANAMRKPGEWNVYDIIYTAPTFKEDGSYRTHPTVTVIQNGVVLQNHTTILGTTEWIGFPQVKKHGAGPIICRAMAILASRSASVISGFVSYKRNVLIVIRRDGLDIKFIPFSLNNRLVLYERNIFSIARNFSFYNRN